MNQLTSQHVFPSSIIYSKAAHAGKRTEIKVGSIKIKTLAVAKIKFLVITNHKATAIG